MNKIGIFATLFILLMTSCGTKSELEKKKDELSKAKQTVFDLQKQIKQLEIEVAKLDTSAGAVVKIKTIASTPVQTSVFRHYVSVQGTLEAEENLMVTSKIPGQITAVKVKEGDVVRQGQIVAVLDDELIRKSIDEVKSSLDQVLVMYNKQKALWDQKIGTEMQYLTLKNQKESLEKKMETLNSQVNQNYVTAPFSGVIDDVFVKVGSIASPGVPLMQLVNTNDLKATAKVPDSYVAFIKQGDQVKVNFPDLNKTIDASVTYVGRIVDPMSRTFKIEVKLPGGNPDLKPNLMSLIQINDKTSNSAIVIEENIVQPTEEGKIVFVTADDKGKKVARQKTVTTGLSYNGKVEILSGLTVGEELITTGYQDLSDNQPIGFK
ncbi:MAG TPA: efflux RND transporter periplasmic adaptor subunit [Catalimonadaceae bacterium]|nr:efflux RND transporter periplasmic adaptor subunit [Catalimonadaceae bacterium]HPI11511.1 efflux RND transporter periplasmic adaptor subunit [Catalimonadaceae bacterium]